MTNTVDGSPVEVDERKTRHFSGGVAYTTVVWIPGGWLVTYLTRNEYKVMTTTIIDDYHHEIDPDSFALPMQVKMT